MPIAEPTASEIAEHFTFDLERFNRCFESISVREFKSIDPKVRSALLRALHQVNSNVSRIF